jgi:hypothetical protein
LNSNQAVKGGVILAVIGFVLVIGIIVLAMWGLPKYKIYNQDKRGQATLREAEWTKKVAIESAKAKKESATYIAQAEIERAKGVAEANKIIGESLKNNEGYLQYLWIDSLTETSNRIIYVPTEANIPIMEAGRTVQ